MTEPPAPRGPSPGHHPRLASIEACRGVAATMVVVYHASGIFRAPANFGVSPFGDFFQFGRSGVDFFFALSGFLIALLHWRDIGQPDRLSRYANRRLTRVYPTYWLVLVLVIPFDIFTHTLFDNYSQPFEVLKAIFLIPQNQTIIDVTWSMRNELLFYCLFALMILNRRVGIAFVCVWTAALAVRPLLGATDDLWGNLITYPMNIEFLAGAAAGWAFQRVTIHRPALLLAAGAVGFVALWLAEDALLFAHIPTSLFMLRCALYGLVAVAVIVGLSGLELDGRLRMPAILTAMGGASYLIYLVHVPALLILAATERHAHLLRFFQAWQLATLYIVLILVGVVAMHRWIETPMLAAIRGKPRQPASLPA